MGETRGKQGQILCKLLRSLEPSCHHPEASFSWMLDVGLTCEPAVTLDRDSWDLPGNNQGVENFIPVCSILGESQEFWADFAREQSVKAL